MFNHTSTNYTFAPVIIGSGAGTRTVRVEAGKTILTAASTYTGPTIINGGTLSVNGSIASSAVTVNAGGTLGGNGTVGNTTINGGTLAPGNSIGLLTVNGSLSFTAASSYMVEISPTNADRVNVTGTATLGGATVNAIFAAGTYVAKQYTILNATGGLGGSTFGSMVNTNLPQGFKSSLSYDGNNAYLNLALSFIAPPGSGLNRNQQAVGNALVNYFNRNGGIPLVYGGLTAPGLTQASGPIATAVHPTMVQAMTQFMTGITDVSAADRRLGGSSATGFAEESDVMNAYAAVRLRGTDGETFSLNTKAVPPRAGIRIALESVGLGLRRRPDHRRQCGHRIQHHHQPHLRRGGRRRLLAVAGDGRRLCAGRRRHQFQRRLRRQRTNRPVPGRRIHQAHGGLGLCQRGRSLWLA